MNEITILIWITILIIGIIAIIVVKLHYKGNELEQDEGSIIPGSESINGILSKGKEKISSNKLSETTQKSQNINLYPENTPTSNDDAYIVPEANNNDLPNYEYESANQVLIDYGNKVKKFQEPIKQNQMDIMTQNKEDKTELKDLFTIDELIKESKRKDDERDKETPKPEDDKELIELKESIKKRHENKSEPLIEEIVNEPETINGLLDEEEKETEEDSGEIKTSTASQKNIDEAITSVYKEEKEKEKSVSKDKDITDALLNPNNDEIDIPNEEIKEPTLKSPNKVGETKDYEFGAPIDDANIFGDDDEGMDLDYRKDLDRITNKIKGSKLFQEVKDKLNPEAEEIPPHDDEETYIRNVNEYEEFEPIINETHIDYESLYEDADERLRQENSRRVFNIANAPEAESSQQKVGVIKDKPERDNIKIKINNNELVLKKGDEIIFNHLGETYSSQVYAINGDDISVRYRRQNIKIKPEDVKKIY